FNKSSSCVIYSPVWFVVSVWFFIPINTFIYLFIYLFIIIIIIIVISINTQNEINLLNWLLEDC
ncbi:MAG: hypothetical protein N7Q72_05275, partial [Spiroplasma sp. Tabriz.8]|nr:hypothetical protein [Spiroplasma sp. Tabriz.8]